LALARISPRFLMHKALLDTSSPVSQTTPFYIAEERHANMVAQRMAPSAVPLPRSADLLRKTAWSANSSRHKAALAERYRT
jgi:hypothetical protein